MVFLNCSICIKMFPTRLLGCLSPYLALDFVNFMMLPVSSAVLLWVMFKLPCRAAFCELICELSQDLWNNYTKIVFWQKLSQFPTSCHLFLVVSLLLLCIAFVLCSTQLVVICHLICIDLLGYGKQVSVCSSTTGSWTKCVL